MNRLRVGLLSNPSAAHGQSRRVGRQVSHLLHMAGLSVVDLSGPNEHVARARAEEVKDTLTALIVVGGDGTVSVGAGIVAGSPVRLGVVPAGSGNDFARAMGIPVNDPTEAVRRLLHALSRPVVTIDAISITQPPGHGVPHRSVAVGNASLGFDALVNARANSARFHRGGVYSRAVARELPSFRPIPYTVQIDDAEPYDVDATFLTVCNTGIFGGGMKIDPSARVNDGQLNLVTVKDVGRAQLLRFFPRVYRGTHTTVPGFSSTPVTSVTVSVRDQRFLRAYADGEPRSLLPITARVVPDAIRILAPIPTHAEARLPGDTAGAVQEGNHGRDEQ